MTTWTVRLATAMDAASVYDNRWDRGGPEIERFGVSRDCWLRSCARMAAARSCFTILRDGEPEAILGGERGGDGLCHISFQAISVEHLPGLSRYMRRVIPALAKVAGATVTAITVFCAHPLAERWYQFLGFTEDNDYRGSEFSGRMERRFIRAWR